MDAGIVCENLRAISADFATQRRERQQRRELKAADFARLRDAGFLLTGVPVDHGGVWESVGSARCCARSPMATHRSPWSAQCILSC
jgi:hypothetical protein